MRSGADNAPALFLYIALLDLGLAAVALRKRWHYLVLLAAIGTAMTQLGWAAQFFDATKGGRAFWIFLGFEALFLAIYFLGPIRLQRMRSNGQAFKAGTQETTAEGWTTAAAVVAGVTALGFSFWLSAIPTLARQPLFFFGFTFLADAGLLALPVIGRAHRGIALGAGGLTFILVAEWIGLFAHHAPLSVALAAIVIFALLHAATVPASAWRPGVLAFHRRRHGDAISSPGPFDRTGGGLESDAGFCRRSHSRWNPARRRDSKARGLALRSPPCLGAGLVELTWQAVRFSNEQAIPTLVCYGLFLIFFVAFPFCSAEKEKAWSWAMSALAQTLQFWLIYRAITLAFPNEWMGLLPAIFVLPGAIGVWALLKLYRADPASGDSRLAWQGGALLLFVSLIFPLQFEREWITLGWALEGLWDSSGSSIGCRIVVCVSSRSSCFAPRSLGWRSIPRSSSITSAPPAASGTGIFTPMG